MSQYDDNNPWGDEPDEQADTYETQDPLDDLAAARQQAAPAPRYAPGGVYHQGYDAGPPLDEYGRLIGEAACLQCGYNLHGQQIDGTCPECGLAVAHSARGDDLQYCDPQWVGSLKNGMLLLIIGVFASIVLGFVNMGISMALQPSFAATPTPAQQGRQQSFNQMMQASQATQTQLLVTIVISLVSTAIFVFAVWMLTAPEPGRSADGPVSRPLLRWTYLIAAGLGLAGNVIALASPLGGPVVSGIGGILMIVSFFAFFIYLRRLALRVPDRGLAGQTRTVMWGIVCGYGVMILGGVLFMVFAFSAIGGGGSSPSGGMMGLMFVGTGIMCISIIALLVFGIWALVLLFLYRSRFAYAEQCALHYRQHTPAQPAAY